jgi:hypothetical protein
MHFQFKNSLLTETRNSHSDTDKRNYQSQILSHKPERQNDSITRY